MPTHTATITKLTRAIKRDPQNIEHLFQTLLHRTFAEEMCCLLPPPWPAELLYYRQPVI